MGIKRNSRMKKIKKKRRFLSRNKRKFLRAVRGFYRRGKLTNKKLTRLGSPTKNPLVGNLLRNTTKQKRIVR